MVKKYNNLINQITSIDNLRLAYKKTCKGKRASYGYLEFKEYAEANILLIQEELKDQSYKIGEYRKFVIYEPKARLISALDFKDRLVQHALCNVIEPIFQKTFMPYTFACRENYGTHAGIKYIQSQLRKGDYKYFLKTDYSKYFPSINKAKLHLMYERKISCKQTLQILREIIKPDGVGIEIGSLTSQLSANIYGNAVDRFIHFDCQAKPWARYMDDIVILGNNPNELHNILKKIVDFSLCELDLKIGKRQVSPTSQGINFLGYRIWPTHKLLRKDSVTRAKRKIARFINNKDKQSLSKFLASWSGHAQWADTHHLFKWLENKHAIKI